MIFSNPRDARDAFHAVAQQRPAFDRQDGCFVRPLLSELAAPVDYLVERRA